MCNIKYKKESINKHIDEMCKCITRDYIKVNYKQAIDIIKNIAFEEIKKTTCLECKRKDKCIFLNNEEFKHDVCIFVYNATKDL